MKHALWLGVTAVLAVFCACSQPQVPKPLDAVSVQLKWVHQAQFAGQQDVRSAYSMAFVNAIHEGGGK